MENIFDTDQENIRDILDGEKYKERLDFLQVNDNISFTWNTDGVPVFESSNFSIWPLLLTINEVKPELRSEYVLLQGLHFGQKKPLMSTYLKPFVKELKSLYDDGLCWRDSQGEQHITKCIALLSCVDSPARATLQNIKQFNGKFGCSFCEHPGVIVEKGRGFTRAYPISSPLPNVRNGHGMLQQGKEAETTNVDAVFGVKGVSELHNLPFFDLSQSFSPDYMHSCLLGVVRQILNLLFDSTNHAAAFYLGPQALRSIDDVMISFCPPSDISRSPRSIAHRAQWKANEFRCFLLFYSPIVFENIMETNYYLHWLLLVNAIHILVGRDITKPDIVRAKLYMYKFVVQMKQLYGIENVSFNVHLLTHLADSVLAWGPLWATSAFIFEDSNRKLLNMFHGTQGVQIQIVKHFLGYKQLTEKAASCMGTASAIVQDTFSKLT